MGTNNNTSASLSIKLVEISLSLFLSVSYFFFSLSLSLSLSLSPTFHPVPSLDLRQALSCVRRCERGDKGLSWNVLGVTPKHGVRGALTH